MSSPSHQPLLGNRGDSFFLVIPLLLLGFVLVGFSRSFYLQTAFNMPPLPWHLHAHGAILTSWFVVAAVQPWLIRFGRVAEHRKLAIFAVVNAIGVIAISTWTVALRDAPTIAEFPARATGNLASLLMFATCLGFGLLLRKRPDAHKRLMLLASIPLVAPALDRIGRFPVVAETMRPLLAFMDAPVEEAVAIVGFLALVATVLIFDLIVRRRPHRGTLLGLTGLFLIAPAAAIALTASGMWASFVTLLA